MEGRARTDLGAEVESEAGCPSRVERPKSNRLILKPNT
jgi:hypothetical protein